MQLLWAAAAADPLNNQRVSICVFCHVHLCAARRKDTTVKCVDVRRDNLSVPKGGRNGCAAQLLLRLVAFSTNTPYQYKHTCVGAAATVLRMTADSASTAEGCIALWLMRRSTRSWRTFISLIGSRAVPVSAYVGLARLILRKVSGTVLAASLGWVYRASRWPKRSALAPAVVAAASWTVTCVCCVLGDVSSSTLLRMVNRAVSRLCCFTGILKLDLPLVCACAGNEA